MIKGSTYSSYNVLRFVVLFIVSACFLFSCSKPDEGNTPTPPPIPVPPSPIPTGVIDYFNIDDTLIGYNKSTFARWLVSGTNAASVTTFGGNPVGHSGPFSTGLLKKDSLFVLLVNNGQKKQQWVYVADSITTKLYNEGKFAQKIKTEVYTESTQTWRDTTMAMGTPDERVFFNLNGMVTIIVIGNPSYSGGRFTITDVGTAPNPNLIPSYPGTPTVFRWRNVDYIVTTLSTSALIVKYRKNEASGAIVDWRDTFVYR